MVFDLGDGRVEMLRFEDCRDGELLRVVIREPPDEEREPLPPLPPPLLRASEISTSNKDNTMPQIINNLYFLCFNIINLRFYSSMMYAAEMLINLCPY